MMVTLMMVMMMVTVLVWRSARHQIAGFRLNLHHCVCVFKVTILTMTMMMVTMKMTVTEW